ncbi:MULTISPECIES: sugar 3,4-ketoisomerase [Sphingobacterium]|jgi:WxcM-like, C-terminal|uniref:sugar 3,4-ketoisomerase n=1 Tax=Sphingobacterium TaxID=28453 RepID=UPI00257A3EDC|nr:MULTISPECIES: FdtA/QdtA family cupin domain-containing protein [Sphingobacterium]
MHNVFDCSIVDLPLIHNQKGNITVLENNKSIPFEIKRIYYLYDVPYAAERGGHAHYELQQFVVAACGSFTFILDDGVNKREVFLNSPRKALHIKPGIWREMKDFSGGSICLVLASSLYSEKDYIRDYQEFLNYRMDDLHK